jgi:folate-dependent phosphoribosylglycinamide formyltransferase PurN
MLTAGYDKAPQAIALCQLLRRDGVEVAGIVVQSVDLKRIRSVLRSGGLGALRAARRKALGGSMARRSDGMSPITAYFAETGLEMVDLRTLAARNRIPYQRVKSLNDASCRAFVSDRQPDGVIYCGGGMLRPQLLEAAGRRVLNAHAGPLPEIRGMNAAEWSILTGRPLQVTIHYLDEGVDTGPILTVRPFKIRPGDDVASLRERSIVAGIEGLRGAVESLLEPVPERTHEASVHPQYFTVAPFLRPVLDRRLEARAR